MNRKELIAELDRLGLVRPSHPPRPRPGDTRLSRSGLMAMSIADLERKVKKAREAK